MKRIFESSIWLLVLILAITSCNNNGSTPPLDEAQAGSIAQAINPRDLVNEVFADGNDSISVVYELIPQDVAKAAADSATHELHATVTFSSLALDGVTVESGKLLYEFLGTLSENNFFRALSYSVTTPERLVVSGGSEAPVAVTLTIRQTEPASFSATFSGSEGIVYVVDDVSSALVINDDAAELIIGGTVTEIPEEEQPPVHVHSWEDKPYDYVLEGTTIYSAYACSGCSQVRKDIFIENVVSLTDTSGIDGVTVWSDAAFAVSPATAQTVLDKIGNNSTVYLTEGTYEALQLKNSGGGASPKTIEGLSIIGQEGTVLSDTDTSWALTFVTGNSGVSIKDFSVRNVDFLGNGILVSTGRNQTNTFSGITLSECNFKGNEGPHDNAGSIAGDVAIRLYVQDRPNETPYSDLTIENCVFDNYWLGLLTFQMNNVTVRNSSLSNMDMMFDMQGTVSGTLEFTGNVIDGCTYIESSNSQGNAWGLFGLKEAVIIIRGNQISDHLGNTIVYINDAGNNVTVTVEDNTYEGTALENTSAEDISNKATGYPNSWSLGKNGISRPSDQP